MKTKQCSKCKQVKPASGFGKNKKHSTGYNSWCKQCVRESSKRYAQTPRGIYAGLKSRMNFYHTKPVIISKEEFITWYNETPNICAYCDIPENLLEKLIDTHNNARTRLTIDCKDNDAGYIKGNIVFACNRCNNTKNNFFDYETLEKLHRNT